MKIAEQELPKLTHQFDGLDVFVVGGWVRDFLRGVESKDVDLMVTGVTEEEMLDRDFRHIDSPNNETFGVFQDAFGREVALAREESSTGDGHRDFKISPVGPNVPHMEAVKRDLVRRDIRYNSMAIRMSDGQLIDPHDGKQDLEDSVIRATDPTSFKQDALRVLRVARFAARTGHEIGDETMEMMREVEL